MTMRVYYDRDADVNLVKSKKVAIIGYGSQGHAHANNLRDSGVKEVVVALRPGSASVKKAEEAGLRVMNSAEAAKWADIVMVLTPDELQAALYAGELRPNMREGTALAFAHGLSIHFRLIEPRPDMDVFMIAPKGPGHRLIESHVRAEMKKILADIQSGNFAREWVLENTAGQPSFKALRRRAAEHEIEKIGEKLRAMMPWIAENRLVDRSRN